MERPSAYTKELADEIVDRLVEGESLASICRSEHMPRYARVFDWIKLEPDFADNYARARDAQGDTDADKIGDVQDRVLRGEIDPAAARVAIDALKWTAARRQPKKYGDKIETTVQGPNGGPVQVQEIKHVVVRPEKT